VRRQVLIAAYLATGAFFTAHAANGLVWQGLVLPPDPSSVAGEAEPAALPPEQDGGLVELISHSSVFAAEIPPGAAVFALAGTAGPAGAMRAAPIEAAKKVRLVGTVLRDGHGVLAVLQDLITKKQKSYRPHDNVPGLGELAEIRRDGVVIHEGGQWELLRLPTAVSAAMTGTETGTAGDFPNYRVLDRVQANKAAANLASLQAQFRVVPVALGGRAGGLRLDAFAAEGFVARLGLQPGDVIQRVNGVRVADAGALLSLFSQLPHEDSFTLDLLRQGRPVTINYELR
jgi:general secretion pathway protein C